LAPRRPLEPAAAGQPGQRDAGTCERAAAGGRSAVREQRRPAGSRPQWEAGRLQHPVVPRAGRGETVNSADDQLADLARRHGIEPDYIDAWGNRQAVSPDTLRALLRAMDIPASSDAEVRASLERAREAEERLLPPVLVATAGEPAAVALTLPAGSEPARLKWSLALEAGEVRSGEQATDELSLADGMALNGSRYERRLLPLP